MLQKLTILGYACSRMVCTQQARYFSRTSFIMSAEVEKDLKRAAQVVKESKAIVITAGAGIGVDSGLPDFRGPEGFWKAYPPLKKLGLTLPETSTPRWFDNDPQFAWGFFGHRLNLYRNTQPHRGFSILRKWGESKKSGYFIFTSNVDGHFQKAGFSEDNVVECHGSINFLQKVDGRGAIWPTPSNFKIIVDEDTLKADGPLPRGPPDADPSQQDLARPNILMFGDFSFIDSRTEEQMQRFDDFVTRHLNSNPFVVIEIGAGTAVPTVRWRGEKLVRERSNGTLLRINPTDTDIPNQKHISLPLRGLEALEKLDMELEKM